MRSLVVLQALFLVATCGAIEPQMECPVGATNVAEGIQVASDCSASLTDTTGYVPVRSTTLLRIPVVFHVIKHNNGTGALPDSIFDQQIRVLNECFLALPGTSGENSTDTRIMFAKAAYDTLGQPASGITITTNSTWFADSAPYTSADSAAARELGWDPTSYLNFYTNNYSLGYTYFPWEASGHSLDGVRVLYSSAGVQGGYFGLGRIAVHEIGHWLSLQHTALSHCDSLTAPDCWRSGDWICDTTMDTQFNRCGPMWHCDSTITTFPPYNHESYDVDSCRTYFTLQQAARMRCGLINYHRTVYDSIVVSLTSNAADTFFIRTCPGGDGPATNATTYIVDVDFLNSGMRHDIAAHEITLRKGDALGYAFWPDSLGGDIIADSAATSANQYRTTITLQSISGCAVDSAVVSLNNVPIGRVLFNGRSPDFLSTSPGIVDAADLALFSATFRSCRGGCPGGPPYNACADLDTAGTSAGHVDSQDLAAFAQHFGSSHKWAGYSSKPLFEGARVAFVPVTTPGGQLTIGVDIEADGPFDALILRLDFNSEMFRFGSWLPAGSLGSAEAFGFGFDDEDWARVVVVALNGHGWDGSKMRLGNINWQTTEGADFDRDVQFTRGEFLRLDGRVLALVRTGKADSQHDIMPRVTSLGTCEPNPFNPATVIPYVIAKDTQVTLTIYNSIGRRVRTLVDNRQQGNAYRVIWDGKDGRGQQLANGIYFARLVAGEVRQSQKLVLIR